MKSNVKSRLYFSAYPLKAIKQPSASTEPGMSSPYLRLVLAGKSKASSRVRIFPMANPYRKEKTGFKPVKPAKNVEPRGTDWFNHYE